MVGWVVAAASMAGVGGCGKDRAARSWISDEAAVIECTVSGPDRLQPVLGELPIPVVPTGMYARRLDPLALDAMGYTREHVACATIDAPSPESIAALGTAVAKLTESVTNIDRESRIIGSSCNCEVAREAGVRDLLLHCRGVARTECDVTPEQIVEMRELTQPLVDRLTETPVPFLHWRLAGPTDRPGWFVDHLPDLLERHPGGSSVYTSAAAVPGRENHRLIKALLAVPGVVAVVRQDVGQALLVVRETGGDLVLDHFQYPRIEGTRVILRTALDNVRTQDYIDALAPPETIRKLMLAPTAGNLVELDRPSLERLDGWLAAGSGIWRAYPAEREVRTGPPAYADRVAIQAPFGRDGKVLSVRMALNEEGRAWAAALPEGPLFSVLEAIPTSDEPRRFVPPVRDVGFMFRGSALENVLFQGLSTAPAFLASLEVEAASSLDGTATDFTVSFPTGQILADVPTAPGYRSLRERVSKMPYQLTGTFDPARTTLTLQLLPQ